jgi:hypothetical protein
MITLFISGCVGIFYFKLILNGKNYKNSCKYNIIVPSNTCIPIFSVIRKRPCNEMTERKRFDNIYFFYFLTISRLKT